MLLSQAIIFVAITSLAITIWKVIYNLFLHPLARVPGPKLAAASVWYERYFDLYLPGQYPFHLKRLHDKYGPIIRPTPDNEVHINDPDFLDTIYALRGRNHHVGNGLLCEKSVVGAEDYALHKLRRDALNPYFSQKAVVGMEELMMKKTNQMIKIIENDMGKVTNMSDLFFAFSNDLVRVFCFGSDNGLLENPEEASRQRGSLMQLLSGIKVNNHFPWIPKSISRILGEKGTPPAVKDLLEFKANTKKDIDAVFADKSDKENGKHSVFYDLRDSPTLPPQEKTVDRLQDEATILLMAGTAATAKSLQYGIYYVLANPDKLARLRSELDSACARYQEQQGTSPSASSPIPRVPLSTLLTLPYLNATIDEVNRLTYGVTSRIQCYTPTETLTYTSRTGPWAGTTYVLPPGTRMSCTTWCTHTNEDLFPDPLAFEPERFLSSKNISHDDDDDDDNGVNHNDDEHDSAVRRRKRATMALGKGDRRCLGMHLAHAGMALAFDELFARWDLSLAEGTTYEDVEFKHDYHIAFPRLDTKGIRVNVNGRRKQGSK